MEHYSLRLKKAPQIFTEKYYSNALAAATAANCCARSDAGRLYVGTDKGVLVYENARFSRLSGIYSCVSALCALPGGRLAAAVGANVYLIENDRLSLMQPPFLRLPAPGAVLTRSRRIRFISLTASAFSGSRTPPSVKPFAWRPRPAKRCMWRGREPCCV